MPQSLVLPAVVPESNDCVTVSDDLVGHSGELVADFPKAHEHTFQDGLGLAATGSQREVDRHVHHLQWSATRLSR